MEFPHFNAICGTGHRPDKLGGYDDGTSHRLKTLAMDWLVKSQPNKVISGMALGWDTALAEASYLVGIPFLAAIPFKGQELAWPKQSQTRYKNLLTLAQEIIYVSEGGYAAWKMQVRNKWMVDNSKAVLALYNGDPYGGTYNCVRYAKEQKKEVINLWNDYQNS